MLLEMRLEPILAVLPVGPPTRVLSLVVCSDGRRAEVVKLRDLEGLELAVFPSLWPWCLEKWFRLTDLADGSPPRTLSVVGDDNTRERV